MVRMQVTQVTFLSNGEVLIAGVPVNDATKVIIATAPEEVGLEIAQLLAGGMSVVAEPPDEAVRDVLEP